VQEHHDLADGFLLRPRVLDQPAAFGADAVQFLQTGRLGFDDFKNLLAEFVHELLGIDGADAFDHAAAQIFLDAFLGGGRGAVQHLGPELEAELPILHPAAFSRHPFHRHSPMAASQ